MRAEDLRQWFIYATPDNTLDATNRMKLVAIVQAEFCDWMMAEECTWQKFLLIPKGASRDCRGIRLVEVLLNTVTSLLNHQLTTAMKLHDVLHRCQAGQGTGNAALESKLLQQLRNMRKEVLF